MGALDSKIFGAGKLDRMIDFLVYASGVDAVGAPKENYEKSFSAWANVKFLRGKETDALSMKTGITKVSFVIRHRTDLDTKMRIKYDSKSYDIIEILEIEGRDNYLSIVCNQVEAVPGSVSSGEVAQDENNEELTDERGETLILQ